SLRSRRELPAFPTRRSSDLKVLNPVDDEVLARILRASALNTDAYLEKVHEDGPWGVVGDTTEGALLVASRKAGWTRSSLEDELRSEEHTSELQSRENLVCRL